MTCPLETSLPGITIVDISNCNSSTLQETYKKCHFNLLLSLDHSKLGFIEGFGLTCLEAGQFGTPSIVFNTGGLPENVHTGFNGFVMNGDSYDVVKQLIDSITNENYELMRLKTFKHTTESHSLDIYKRLFRRILCE